MKKILLSLVFVLAFSKYLTAQCPEQIVVNGPTSVAIGTVGTYFVEEPAPGSAAATWLIVKSDGTLVYNGQTPSATLSYTWNATGTYQVTAITTDHPAGCTTAPPGIIVTVTNNTVISAPSSISGSTIICQGTSTSTFSVPSVSGLTSQWFLEKVSPVANVSPSPATLTAAGNQVTVNWNGASTGTYTLVAYYNNGTYSGAERLLNIYMVSGNVSPILQNSRGVNSSDLYCVGESATYTAFSDASDTYTWSLSGGGVLTSSGNSATIMWNSTGTFTLSVTASSSCNSTPRTTNKTISIGSSLSVGQISKQNTLTCVGQTQGYSVAPVTGVTSYVWDLSLLADGTSSPTTSTSTTSVPSYSINFSFAGTGSLKVTASNGYCSASSSMLVESGLHLTLNSPSITCIGNQVPLSVSSFATDVSGLAFNWNVGDGAMIGSSSGANVITQWPTAGFKNISATTAPGICASGSATNQASPIHVQESTLSITPITGISQACKGPYTYAIYNTTVTGSSTSTWGVTLANGGSAAGNYSMSVLQSSGNANSVVITWTVAGDYIVTSNTSNSCTNVQSQTLNVHVADGAKPVVNQIDGTTYEPLCSQTLTTTKTYSTNAVAGYIYDWALSDPSTTANTITSSNNTATVNWNQPTNSAIISLTPRTLQCSGEAVTLSTPYGVKSVVTTPSSFSICGGLALNIPLTASVSAASFTWVASDNPNVGGESTSLKYTSTITDVLTNLTDIAQTVTYTVTPSVNYCVGSSQTITVTVNPLPITYSNSASVCSGSNINYALTSSIPSSFTWAATDNTNTTGESTTTQNSSTITDVINNPTTSPQTLVYTVTPTSSGGGCIGAAKTLTFSINPKPSMTSASSATICSGGSVSIPLTSTVTSSFSWSATDNPNTTGELTTAQSSATLANTITNTTTSPQSVIYTVTPTSNLGCIGTTQTVTATVNPIPTASASNQTICSGQTTSMLLNSTIAGTTFSWSAPVQTGVSGGSAGAGSSINQLLSTTSTTSGTANYTVTPSANSCVGTPIHAIATVNPTPTITNSSLSNSICSGTALNFVPTVSISGATFSWTSSITGTVTGVSASGSANITDTPVNTGTAPATIVYTITPILSGCSGPSVNYTVTVNPKPAVTAANQNICSGSATNVNLSSTVGGTTFSWPAPTQSNVSGGAAGSGSSIAQTLSVVSTGTGTATYQVTPSANGCSGSAYNVQVQVTTTPVVSASNQSMCSGQTTNIPLSSNVSGTTFSWASPTMTNASGGSAGSGSSITQTLTATSSAPGQVVYSIVPTANGCSGATVNVNVTVNPYPVGSANNQTIISGQTSSVALSSTVAGTSFVWGAPTQTNVSGGTAGNGTSINQTLTNNSSSSGTATYAVSPTAAGCTGGTFSPVVTVTPAPLGNTQSHPISAGGLVPGTTFTDTQNNNPANGFGNDYTGANAQPSDDIYYFFFLPQNSTVQLSTQGSPTNTFIHLLNSSGTQLAFNDDAGGGTWSYLTANLNTGPYFLVVEGSGTASGPITTTITIPSGPPYPITWTDLVGVSANGNTITKTDGSYLWNSGAASVNYIPANTNGWIEMTLTSTNWDIMFGLSSSNADASWNTIEYDLYISRRNAATVQIYRSGTLINSNASAFAANDKFRVERNGSTMYFKRNGATIYSITGNAAEVLRADVSMFDPNSQIASATCSHTTSGQGGRALVFPQNLTVGNYNTNDSTTTLKMETRNRAIYPNPTTGKFAVEYGYEHKTNVHVKIMNPMGIEIYSTLWNPEETEYQLSIDLENNASGIYIVYIDEKTFKLIKN